MLRLTKAIRIFSSRRKIGIFCYIIVKNGLFVSNNPLFCFIVNYMQFAFLPIYYEFSMLFEQFFMIPPQSGLTKPPAEPTAEDFFQNKALTNEMLWFFENLPRQFKNFLCLLHEFIKQSKNPNDHAPSSTALRGLLINRFLFNPMLKMMADPDIAMNSSYLKAANYFKDLFYSKNLAEKYNNIPQFSHLCFNYVKAFNQVLIIKELFQKLIKIDSTHYF